MRARERVQKKTTEEEKRKIEENLQKTQAVKRGKRQTAAKKRQVALDGRRRD